MFGNYPEPSVTPPESEYFTASGCRHEVYEGAEYYVYMVLSMPLYMRG